MNIAAIIPARFLSSRFPGKPLARLHGRPVIQHVYENATRARTVHRVIVATDHEKIFDAVISFGGEAVMTPSELPSGSDRVAHVAKNLDCDIIVNVQGDEPLLSPDMIDMTVTVLKESHAHIGTLARKISTADDLMNPNVVKVVFDHTHTALYFSRAPIPYYRDEFSNPEILRAPHAVSGMYAHKHIGIYSYRRDILLRLTRMSPSRLETAEKLEQLRALENGFSIAVGITDKDTIGVDTPDDLERVKAWLSLSS